MSDVKAIRKHTAQHDLFNRLHSIAADGRFVQRVAREWYDGRFDVVGESRQQARLIAANQRCGMWYCDPSVCLSWVRS
jgi:tRNA A64-2'-O-ribosylphosphate transferase